VGSDEPTHSSVQYNIASADEFIITTIAVIANIVVLKPQNLKRVKKISPLGFICYYYSTRLI